MLLNAASPYRVELNKQIMQILSVLVLPLSQDIQEALSCHLEVSLQSISSINPG